MTEKDQKYQELYQAALTLFSTFGYKKTTIEDVAAQLNMTKGNLYFYVKNKKALYENTIHWALTQWQDHVKEAVNAKASPAEQFRVMAKAAMAYIDTNTPLRNLLINDPGIFTLSKEKDRFPRANARAKEMIRSILEQGVREQEFYPMDIDQTTAYLFSVYMMFLIQTYVHLDRNDFHSMFEAALELNLRGLIIKYPSP